MNVKDSALLSQATYIMGDKRKSRQDKYDEINNLVKDTGYTVIPKYTNKNLVTFENEKGGVHVAHQGTNVKSTTGFKDIVSDIGIALGLADHLPSVRKRKRQTERVVRELKPEEFTLSGHSLGGYTVNQTLSSSKKVRNALTHPIKSEHKRTIITASGTSKLKSFINFAESTAQKLITAAVDRSISPAIIS